MKRPILYRAKRIDNNEWIEGFPYITATESYIINPETNGTFIAVRHDTLCQYTGHTLSKGHKVFEGTVAFYEEERDHGDLRYYVICLWLEEFNMFTWLHMDEYRNYLKNGVSAIDEELMWTYGLDNSSSHHHAGNIFDQPELIDMPDPFDLEYPLDLEDFDENPETQNL